MKVPAVVLLTAAEEIALSRRVRAWLAAVEFGDADSLAADGLAARNELVERFLPLVPWTIANLCRSDMPTDYEEDTAVGMFALLRAAEKFDPDLGFRFYTYATNSIARSIWRWRAEQQRGAIRLTHSCDSPPRWVGDAEWALQSIAAPDAEAESESDPARVLAEVLAAARLDARELDVVRRVFGVCGEEKVTLEACGRRHGVTKERTRQIRNRAIDRVRTRVPRPEAI